MARYLLIDDGGSVENLQLAGTLAREGNEVTLVVTAVEPGRLFAAQLARLTSSGVRVVARAQVSRDAAG